MNSEREIISKLTNSFRLNESKVGAFYIINDKIISNDIDVRQGDSYGNFINYSSHWDLWKVVQILHPEFRSNDYDDYPRGRVIFNKSTNKYIIYLDPKLNKPKYINLIRNQYNLSTGSYIIGKDEHYQSIKESTDGSLDKDVIIEKDLSYYIDKDTY